VRLKLDENLGKYVATTLRQSGHDVTTVSGEGLAGSDDPVVIAVCRDENRCLVTLDVEFGNPLLFPPSRYAGIAVLRLPHQSTFGDLLATVQTLIAGLEQNPISGQLWIVQRNRIRHYQPDS